MLRDKGGGGGGGWNEHHMGTLPPFMNHKI